MARPSRTSFAKRQKEMARSEKRKSKLARRQKPKGEDGLTTDAEAADETDGALPDDAEGQDAQ